MAQRSLADMLLPHRQRLEGFEQLEPKLEGIWVKRVKVGAGMQVFLQSDRAIEPDDFCLIQQAMAIVAGGRSTNVRCSISFPTMAEQIAASMGTMETMEPAETVETEPSDTLQWLYRWLSADLPGQLPFLRNAQWFLEEGCIRLSVGRESAEMLRQQGKEQALQTYLQQLLDVDWRLRLMISETDDGMFLAKAQTEAALMQSIQAARSGEAGANAETTPPAQTAKPQKNVKLVQPAKSDDLPPWDVSASPAQSLASQVFPQTAPRKKEPSKPAKKENNYKRKRNDDHPDVLRGSYLKGAPLPLSELRVDMDVEVTQGDVLAVEWRETRNGKWLLMFDITDHVTSVSCKMFLPQTDGLELQPMIQPEMGVRISGRCEMDSFTREMTLMAESLNKAPKMKLQRQDHALRKRVELHLHTQMSAMDAMVSPASAVQTAALWGHPAVAITDHGVVQGFPEAYDAAKGKIKVICGVEGYLLDDTVRMVAHPEDVALADVPWVVFDVETTGLDAKNDRLIEIGAVRIRDGKIAEHFQTFIQPHRNLSQKIIDLTGITDSMLKDAPEEEAAVAAFLAFAQGSVLAAHNSDFDMGFMREAVARHGIDHLPRSVLDTLVLARMAWPKMKSHSLVNITKALEIPQESHHRADQDAESTAKVLLLGLALLGEKGAVKLPDLNTRFASKQSGGKQYHIILLAETQKGLENLYNMVSISHLEHYRKRPCIPKSVLQQYREGVIVGAACEAGEVFQGLLNNRDEADMRELAQFYDYLEIQPIANNQFLVRDERVTDAEGLRELNRQIVRLGEVVGRPVVATCDAHFLNPEDEIFRRIIMTGMGFKDTDQQAPLYLRTTEEMLAEFDYLGAETAERVVIDNTIAIAERCETLKPYPDGLFAPVLEGADEHVTQLSWSRAKELYGDPLPQIVQARMDKEMGAIMRHGFSVLYDLAHLLVKKSLDDGYLVGSRGSVGSSLVATMMNITEINPLPPHYRCPVCRHCDFDIDPRYTCGVDLPPCDCPQCGAAMARDGYDISFEVFLGFEGDKVPDIDLNFSGEYQPQIHRYLIDLLGDRAQVYRAGTIGTLASKTAFGFVSKYLEENSILLPKAEVNRLVAGCTGVKRTTGQHPGGMILVPNTNDVHQFTPIQHPADKSESGIITTHYDFNSLHDRLVKLDMLGHDDPTMIRMLEDITGINARELPLDDPEVMSLFSSTESLGVTPEDCMTEVGTYGVPEYGTRFVRQMLVETMPTTMDELVRISGLCHGIDVWTNNAQVLVKEGQTTLKGVISSRDDIMNNLIRLGVASKIAFNIMEDVRKGKGLKEDYEIAMRDGGVPEWFIDSCKKIKYLFPKAHAAAYVTMALRIAWFKVHRPQAYYCAYFSIRAGAFDADVMMGEVAMIKRRMAMLEAKVDATARDRDMVTAMELAMEMQLRNIRFLPVDCYASDAERFISEEEGIRPALNVLEGVGGAAAQAIVAARKDGEFVSVEDLARRARLSTAVITALRKHGCLKNMPETSQMSFF